jgi:hypothetical protein
MTYKVVWADDAGNLFTRAHGTWSNISGHGTGAPSSKVSKVHVGADGTSLCVKQHGAFYVIGGSPEMAVIGALYVDESVSPIAFHTRDSHGSFKTFSF